MYMNIVAMYTGHSYKYVYEYSCHVHRSYMYKYVYECSYHVHRSYMYKYVYEYSCHIYRSPCIKMNIVAIYTGHMYKCCMIF